MMKRNVCLPLLAAAFAVFGCGGDDGKESGPKTCVSDICLDEQTQGICQSDGSYAPKECSGGCVNGFCSESDEATCTEDVCLSTNTLARCVDGHPRNTDCRYGCAGNRCADPECMEDTCASANVLARCVDGHRQDTDCRYGCAGNRCADPECTEDTCASTDVLARCVDGRKNEIRCTNGCSGGRCSDVSSLEGQPCSTEEGASCMGNDLLLCGQGASGHDVWIRYECPTGYSCGTFDDQSVCLEHCSVANEKGSVCSSTEYMSVTLETVCTDTGNGLFFVPDYDTFEACEAGCADRHTCATETCTTGEFEESCLTSDTGRICDGGYVTIQTCASDRVCRLNSRGLVTCSIPCEPATALPHKCYSSGNYYAYANVSCVADSNGVYGYEFAAGDYIYCANYCSGLGQEETGCDDVTGCLCSD